MPSTPQRASPQGARCGARHGASHRPSNTEGLVSARMLAAAFHEPAAQVDPLQPVEVSDSSRSAYTEECGEGPFDLKPVTGRSGLLPTASSLRIQPVTYLAAFGSARAALAKAEENLSAAHGGRAPQAAGGQASREPARRRDATTTLAQGEADMAANKATLEADRISLDYTRITSHSRAASAAPRSRRARLSRSRGPARSQQGSDPTRSMSL